MLRGPGRAILSGGLATAAIVAVHAVSLAAASLPVDYCQVIPIVQIQPQQWGFHGGQPITGASGSYTRGHGNINLTARTVNGIICQVDRVPSAPDRQIVLSVAPKLVYASHTATMFGVLGNIMKIDVRVKSSTDPKCAVGTSGVVTVFASYNNVHRDSVQFSFPAACQDHTHSYTGTSVITNVPPN